MADEPVTAWREPLARRARRWARRNRTAVTAAAAAVLVAVVGLAAVLAVQTRANAALTDANRRLEISNRRKVKANADLKAANERERARFALAQEAIRTFHTGVSEDLLLKQKEFDALRTKLLRGARGTSTRSSNACSRARPTGNRRVSLGHAYREVGELTLQIDTVRDALTVHRVPWRCSRAWRDPDDPEIRRDLGKCWFAVGLLLMRQDGGITEGIAASPGSGGLRVGRCRTAPRTTKPGPSWPGSSRTLRISISTRDISTSGAGCLRRACENWEALVHADADGNVSASASRRPSIPAA